MAYADSTELAALIEGLRGLADYLESSPEVPAPIYSDMFTFPNGDWAEMRAEIDAIAARLGVIAREIGSGHCVATRSFGPIEYRAVAIPPKSDSDNKEGE